MYSGKHKVSFERPLAPGFLHKPGDSPGRKKAQPPPGDKEALYYTAWARDQQLSVWSGSSGWWNWERLFYRWAVSNGYTLDIATSVDLHADPALLEGYRAFVCVGHDEYWSWEMRDNLDRFRAGGGHLCVLSGNTCFWQIRYQNDNKEFVCYKYSADQDPVLQGADNIPVSRLTSAWVDRRIGRPEFSTIGLSFSRGGYSRYGMGVPRGSGAYTVYRPEHWVFDGTGLQYGDCIGTRDCIVAYEVDGCEFRLEHGRPVPLHPAEDGSSILALAPAKLWDQQEQPSRYSEEPGELEAVAMAIHGEDWRAHLHEHRYTHATMLVVEAVGGRGRGLLVNVGVTDWVYGLEGGDADIHRITRNILDRMLL